MTSPASTSPGGRSDGSFRPSPSARVSAAAPASTTTAAAAETTPAAPPDSSVSGGTLARTGAGIGGLGLLGGALFGGGRLLALGRRFLGIG